MKKRSVIVSGHSTSITLEDAFWDALCTIAAEKKLSISALITEIDQSRNITNLSSALRLYILNNLQQKLLQQSL